MDNTKAQIEALAEAHTDAIDTVSAAIKDLYMVIDHLTTQLKTADATIAALKHVLIRNNTCTARDVEEMQATIIKLHNKKMEQQGVDKSKPLPSNVQDELQMIHTAAKEAAETPYDSQAFIFGG